MNKKKFDDLVKNKFISTSAINNFYEFNKNNDKIIINDVENGIDNKKISIVIPTYNRRTQLDTCIRSILAQSYKNFEIIIIDDCSTDDTYFKYRNFYDKRVRYYKNKKNLGVGLNRNKGYLLAKGEYLIFCDDDDYYIDEKYFEKIVEIFENDKINVLCTSSIIHYEKENKIEESILNFEGCIDSIRYLKEFQITLSKPNSTFCAVFRKKTLDDANFKDMKMMNDTSIYLRALMLGGLTCGVKKIVGVYRVHSENLTGNSIKPDFIISNFEEKNKIYLYLRKHNNFLSLKKWYSKQIYISASYFFNGFEKKEDSKLVMKWIKSNVGIGCLFKIYLKKVKNIFMRLKHENK